MDNLLVRNILESMGDCVLVIGAGGDIVFANLATETILGFSPESLKSNGLGLTFFTREENFEFNQIFVDAIHDKSVGRCGEVDYHQPNGSVRRLAVTTSYVVDSTRPARPFVGFMAIFSDVTELFRLREREKHSIEERQRAAARKVEGLRKLAEGVAHEIRNPTTAIGGFASRLLRMKDVPPQAKSYLEKIREGTLRLESLVVQVQEYCDIGIARLSEGCFSDTVEEVIAQIEPAAERRRVNVKFRDETADRGAASFDHGLMRTAVHNLVRNAVDFSPTDSTVDVRLSASPNELVLEVEDHGQGVMNPDMDYIFNPFFSTTADRPGMGLAVAQRIIHEHLGAVTVESEQERGATFRVTFPRRPNPV